MADQKDMSDHQMQVPPVNDIVDSEKVNQETGSADELPVPDYLEIHQHLSTSDSVNETAELNPGISSDVDADAPRPSTSSEVTSSGEDLVEHDAQGYAIVKKKNDRTSRRDPAGEKPVASREDVEVNTGESDVGDAEDNPGPTDDSRDESTKHGPITDVEEPRVGKKEPTLRHVYAKIDGGEDSSSSSSSRSSLDGGYSKPRLPASLAHLLSVSMQGVAVDSGEADSGDNNAGPTDDSREESATHGRPTITGGVEEPCGGDEEPAVVRHLYAKIDGGQDAISSSSSDEAGCSVPPLAALAAASVCRLPDSVPPSPPPRPVRGLAVAGRRPVSDGDDGIYDEIGSSPGDDVVLSPGAKSALSLLSLGVGGMLARANADDVDERDVKASLPLGAASAMSLLSFGVGDVVLGGGPGSPPRPPLPPIGDRPALSASRAALLSPSVGGALDGANADADAAVDACDVLRAARPRGADSSPPPPPPPPPLRDTLWASRHTLASLSAGGVLDGANADADDGARGYVEAVPPGIECEPAATKLTQRGRAASMPVQSPADDDERVSSGSRKETSWDRFVKYQRYSQEWQAKLIPAVFIVTAFLAVVSATGLIGSLFEQPTTSPIKLGRTEFRATFATFLACSLIVMFAYPILAFVHSERRRAKKLKMLKKSDDEHPPTTGLQNLPLPLEEADQDDWGQFALIENDEPNVIVHMDSVHYVSEQRRSPSQAPPKPPRVMANPASVDAGSTAAPAGDAQTTAATEEKVRQPTDAATTDASEAGNPAAAGSASGNETVVVQIDESGNSSDSSDGQHPPGSTAKDAEP